MRAAVYRGKGKVVVETVPVPAIGAGEVLIRVASCGICGTDLKKIQHGFVAAPQIFGHEVCPNRRRGRPGCYQMEARRPRHEDFITFRVERVSIALGDCIRNAPVTRKWVLPPGLIPMAADSRSTCAPCRGLPSAGMVAIPDDISFDEASFIEPVNTCIKAVEKTRVAKGETAVVMGLGPIGLLLAMLSKLEGATVIGSDPMPERRAKGASLGVDLAVDPREGRLAETIGSRTQGRGADVVLVAVPIPSALTDALTLRPGREGACSLFAQNDPLMKIEFPAAAVGVEEKEILGSYSAAIDRASEAAAA